MNFDWAEWGPPLAVVAVGAVIGLAMVARLRTSDRAVQTQGALNDLQATHREAVEALKALETEKDKLAPADYARERDALLKRGSQALRRLEEGRPGGAPAPTPTAPPPAADVDPAAVQAAAARLRLELDQSGPDVFRAALGAIGMAPAASEAPAPAAPAPTAPPPVVPEEAPGLSPAWRGAFIALIGIAVLAYLATVAGNNEIPRIGDPPPPAQSSQQVSAAKEALLARVAANPGDLQAFNDLTQLAISEGDAGAAMQHNQHVLEADPANLDGRTYKAVLAAMVGMLDKSIEALDAVLADDPGHLLALTYKGLVALEAGRNAEAVEALTHAVARQPGNPALAEALSLAQQRLDPNAAPAPAPAAPGGAIVSGTITLDPAKQGVVAAGDLLFVSVRSPQGGPPVASLRLPPGPFPMPFTVTSANLISMGGGPPPAVPAQLTVRAFIDRDGNAMTKEPGMPLGSAEGVAKGSEGVSITLQ